MTHTVLKDVKNWIREEDRAVKELPEYQYVVGMYVPTQADEYAWHGIETFDDKDKAYAFCSYLNGGNPR